MFQFPGKWYVKDEKNDNLGGKHMDLVKIGKYIAGKRKALGLTQVQVADKLGMSDKSVSKWERGVCLPDVSIYMDLCNILGISLNEFLTGEDLEEEKILEASEENLIQIIKDGKYMKRKLKSVIVLLTGICVVLIGVLLAFCIKKKAEINYIEALSEESTERGTAEMLAGTEQAFLYHYSVEDKIQKLAVELSAYEHGVLLKKEKVAEMSLEDVPHEGMIVVLVDNQEHTVDLILAQESVKISTSFDILENLENKAWGLYSATELVERTKIFNGEAQGILALLYGKDSLRNVSIEDAGKEISATENDYMYFLSVEFCE